MRKLLLFTASLFFPFVFFAQQIRGLVTDTAGKPLPFASLYLKENNKGTNANNEGRYVLKVAPGNYTLVCQYVGHKKEEQKITLAQSDMEVNFKLELQGMTMGEVVLKNGEDPAYAIIREAIKKRAYHQAQLGKFECEVYTKGQMRMRNYPDKFLGQKVDFEDGDTSKKKMVYLSETVSRFLVDKPRKAKVEVISSRVSGQSDGFGLAAPGFLEFYENNIFIGNSLNPRGFISPISDNALNYYKYRYEGSFSEDGILVNRIQVIPKRKFEPLFSGYINIVEDTWRIHSLNLLLVKSSQMEVLDTLRVEQLYRPLRKDYWYVSSQVIYPALKVLGFDMYGSFVNVYSGFNPEPNFTKKTFDNTIVKYTDSANKKTNEYWERTRPVPLLEEEVADYRKKDSLELVRKDPDYLDSIDRRRNKVSPSALLLTGKTFFHSKRRSTLTVPSLQEVVSFNPAEGLVINTEPVWGKRLDTLSASRRFLSVAPGLRYGFLNRHFSPRLTVQYLYGKKYSSSVTLSGGWKVFQFNNNSPIGERGNTISCLWDQENRAKTYEAAYFRGSYRVGAGHGLSFTAAFQYQDRSPLENLTDYAWRKRAGHAYTPNYPDELLSSNIQRHQAFILLFGVSWRPGTKYIELPGRKFSAGSKYPLFSIQYMQGVKGLWGSDVDFSKWKFSVSDNMNLKLRGQFRYRLGMGGFLNNTKVELPDYTHFNGNISTLATEYLNSFQLLPIYKYSNTDRFYALGHAEYNLKGFLTNKIPGIRNLNLYLVAAANAFYTSSGKKYFEYSLGIDNIFKQVRVDYVQSFEPGKIRQHGFRIGFSRFTGGRSDNWP
ncbi:MAG: carboxypeptidase-like regulatory domain-containing protein [Chitinophagaceae bacterium]|nr:carboxypeptidase-like regulatory domain-containing protein [Chitinophagaceae bacterium]